MLPEKISFIDIETTGGSAFYDRIIEIGIIRVESNKIVRTFNSLVNPQKHLPRQIELLTGIQASDLENAPTFRAIKDEVLEILSDSYFVAHNVRFDYGFLKNEFRRLDMSFTQKHFCTVKLSRSLYPTYKHHNLDSLIERHGIRCENRHRAMDDAKVLFSFYQKIKNDFSDDVIAKAINTSLKRPSRPLKIDQSTLDNLPETAGVYMFYADTGMPLYVGKSINIRDRVLSHFSSDIRSSTEMNISQQVASIETISTSGELGALLLESKLIKSMLPLYNKRSRIKKELVAIKSRTNAEGYKEVYLETISEITVNQLDISTESNSQIIGFFKSRRLAKEYLTQIAKKNILCEKLLGLQKTKSECFAYRLEKCKGACLGIEKALIYNLRFLVGFAQSVIKPWPFKGPIVIEEKILNGKTEYFLVNKWCYLGNIIVDETDSKNEDLMKKLIFDLDVYRILRRFINDPRNMHKIHNADKDNMHMYNGFDFSN